MCSKRQLLNMLSTSLTLILVAPVITTATDRLVPSPYATIQDAIDACLPMDTVIVSPGTYTGDGNRDISYLGKSITVRSVDPAEPNVVAATIIDCQATNVDRHRAFVLIGLYSFATLEGLTIKNAYQTDGGAIRCLSSDLLISNCVFINNISGESSSLDQGGAIYLQNSDPVILRCEFTSNMASSGGAMYCVSSSSPEVIDCEFSDNNAGTGGSSQLQLQ